MARVEGGLVHVLAYCSVCEWNAGTKNGMGLAAQHTNRTGHETKVETGHGYTVHPDGGKAL